MGRNAIKLRRQKVLIQGFTGKSEDCKTPRGGMWNTNKIRRVDESGGTVKRKPQIRLRRQSIQSPLRKNDQGK